MNDGYQEGIKRRLSEAGVDILEEKIIPYGIQFRTERGSIRIYTGKKGRRTLDLSLLKDDFLKTLLSCAGDAPLLAPPLCGSDEAGKGDWFGPLVVACVYADERMYEALSGIGARDSKKLSDRRIELLKDEIVSVCPIYSVIELKPSAYNDMYAGTGNINTILARAHAEAIKSVMERSGCSRVLVDQFTSEDRLRSALGEPGVLLAQAHRAEENMAVAAASIIARYVYRKRLDGLSEKYGVELCPGSGEAADRAAEMFVKINGREALGQAAKLHFRNTERITADGSL